MATLICKATGLLTGAATFAAAEVGTGALNLIRFNHTGLIGAAASQASAAFTVTNAKVIDGVLLWMRQNAVGSTGTLKVDLQKGGVSQASVTVNKTDLPDVGVGSQNSPVFFKFTGTATGDGAANWTIVLTTTGLQGVNYCVHVSGATNFTRALRTTTNATPAATDDLYVTGELTGAGTHNSFEVTMDSTAATAYGNGAVNSTTVSGGLIAISNWGTLSYGTAAATNYILRVAGDIRVNQYGTLNVGSVGAEIPRNSTAVLEFVQVAADADMGLYAYDYATVNIAGLSRTSGKDVVKCKLTSDIVSNNLLTFGTSTGGTSTSYVRDLEATGTSLFGASMQESAANSTHGFYYNGASVTNVVQTASVWLAQGTGPANNRYLRVALGNAALFTGITNGFWADVDLQAGTISAITNIGTGVGSSATITASGVGWLVKMTGKISTTAATPHFLMNACSAVGTLTYTGNTANWPFIHDHVGLVTAASIPDTSFSVNTDTGWLAGDTVAVSSTTRTAVEVTLYTLNANAGASSFTSALFQNNVQQTTSAFNYTCSGTSPTQAEIGLLTRNVRIRSTSTAFMTFFYCSALATVTASWAEFYRVGGTGVGKRGIEIDAGVTANPKSFTYCSMHDFDQGAAFYSTGGSTSLNVMFANNITWFLGTSVNFISTIVNTDWTVDNCLFMRNFATSATLNDIGGTFTNNTSASATTGNQIALAETNGVIGTFDNNTIHSGGTAGFIFSANGMSGTLNNCTVWRISGGNGGVWYNGMCPDFVLTNLTVFGCTTSNIVYGTTGGTINILNATICGETGFPTTNGINFTTGAVVINMTNVDMSGTGTGQAPHTSDFTFPSSPAEPHGTFINCKFGTALTKTNWINTGYMGYQKYGQTAGDHRCEMKYGQIKTDSTIFNTATPSMRMTPASTANKLESAPLTYGVKIPVAIGSAVDVSVMVKKSDTTAPTVYLGGQPRLIQRSNGALGQVSDIVLATASDTPSSSLTPVPLDSTSGVNVSFTNGDLTVTNTATFNRDQGAHVAPANAKTGGRYYFEATVNVDGFNPSSMVVGIGTTASTHIGIADSATTGTTVLYGSGNLWANGSYQSATIGAWPLGSVGVAVDLDNRRAWFRVLPAGNWNGSGTANPLTNVGGILIPAGAMVPFVTLGGNSAGAGNRITCNFGQSAFIGSVPFGYAPGWGTYTVTSVWAALTGTTSTATDDGIWELVVDCDGINGWINVDDWAFVGAATTANGMKNWYEGIPVVGGGGGGGGGSSGYFSGGFV